MQDSKQRVKSETSKALIQISASYISLYIGNSVDRQCGTAGRMLELNLNATFLSAIFTWGLFPVHS